jgi:hypothetical protein
VNSVDYGGRVDRESILTAMNVINGCGGSMAVTEQDLSPRAAWRPPLEDNFRWMLAQKKGSWFSPPAGVFVNHTPYPSFLVFPMYVLPLAIIVLLAWRTVQKYTA